MGVASNISPTRRGAVKNPMGGPNRDNWGHKPGDLDQFRHPEDYRGEGGWDPESSHGRWYPHDCWKEVDEH